MDTLIYAADYNDLTMLADSPITTVDPSLSTYGANFTAEEAAPSLLSLGSLTLSAFLGILILTTLLGNVFVVYAIMNDRNLKSVGNYLILSLAVADGLVSVTVMPVGAIYEVTGEWSLGSLFCELWTSADVLCCAASILHLVAIALDRYWTVTNIDYSHTRDAKAVMKLLAAVWSVAIIVSLAPLVGWKDDQFTERIQQKECMVSQDVGYQVFATVASFYAPLVVILILYWRIFKVSFDFFDILYHSKLSVGIC